MPKLKYTSSSPARYSSNGNSCNPHRLINGVAIVSLHPIAAIQAAAMPELSDSTTEGPKINVLYVAPGHEIISPDQVEMSKLETVAIGAGTQLARISTSMLVKYGTHASLIEAKTLRFVSEHTSIPVPKLYAAYAYGPLDRDIDDAGSLYDTYIFMEFIEGDTLEKSWNSYDSTTKLQIAADLKEYIEQLRSLLNANYIGSVDRGPVTDVILEWSTSDKGPFDSEKDFNAAIFKAIVSNSKGHIGPYIRGMLNMHQHATVFTHGDFRPANIIVRDGRVVAILDWEMAGWYPEYWEFAKALYLEHFATDWGTHLLDILRPYYFEQGMYSRLMTILL